MTMHPASREGGFLTSAVAHQWQCDHFGHLNVRHYASMFDDAVFVFWNRLRAAGDPHVVPVTAELRITFRSEIPAGTVVSLYGRVVRIGSKSVTLRFEMFGPESEAAAAACETVEVFFSLQARKSQAIPDGLRNRLQQELERADINAST